MGWLEGVLSGYADRHYEIEKQKRDDADKAATREGQVYETLLNSPYQHIKNYALAGMLDLANPRKRSGGVAGWMGEIEKGPYLDMIKRAQARIDADPEYAQSDIYKPSYDTSDDEVGGAPPVTPSIPTGAGSVPASPTLAQPTTTPVQGGQVTPVTPAPSSAPPPAPPGAVAAQAQGQAAPAAVGAPPTPPPFPIAGAPPPPPGQVGRGLPNATTQTVGTPPPVRPSRTQLPGIVPTAGELAAEGARARAAGADLGEQDSYIRVALAQGLTRKEGLMMWADAQMKARGGLGAASPYSWRTMEYTDTTGQKHRVLARTNRSTGAIEDTAGNPLPANAQPVTPGLYPNEMVSRLLATGPILSFPQALTTVRAMYPNATGEEVLDVAQTLFKQSQADVAAKQPPPAAPGGTPNAAPPAAPGGAPGGTPNAAPVTPPAPLDFTPPPDPAPGGVAPPSPASSPAPGAAPGAAPAPVPAHPAPVPQTPSTLSSEVKQILQNAGRTDLLSQRRDVGRQATTQERAHLGAYLLSRQSLDILQKKDPVTQLSLEDRIARQSLGAQATRRLMPDILTFLLPADQQLYKAAAERFSEARVRRVSGAQVRPDEYEMDRQLFFAQPGDTRDVIATKQRLREAEMDAAVFASGPAYEEYFHHPYVATLQQDPTEMERLPPPMPPPAPNRSVPRGPAAPVPSHQAAPPPAPPGTPAAVPPPYKDAQGVWHIYQ